MRGSAIYRIGYERWLRNIAVALGNAGRSDAVLAALEARREHPSALVREHVEWAAAAASVAPRQPAARSAPTVSAQVVDQSRPAQPHRREHHQIARSGARLAQVRGVPDGKIIHAHAGALQHLAAGALERGVVAARRRRSRATAWLSA